MARGLGTRGRFAVAYLLLGTAVGIAVVFGSGLLFKHVTRYVIFFEGSLEGLGRHRSCAPRSADD